jgi:hypothetical protein
MTNLNIQTRKSREGSLTVDGKWEIAKNTWSKVWLHQLDIKIDPI